MLAALTMLRLWLGVVILLVGLPAVRAAAEPGPPAEVETAPVPPPWGVQMYGMGDGFGLARARDLGVRWVRVPVSWAEIEPTNRDAEGFAWEATDRTFRRAAQAGLVPIVTVGSNPPWAKVLLENADLPAFVAEHRQFVAELVGRYAAAPYGVKHWEFYNEPDNADAVNFGWVGDTWGGRGRAYTAMLEGAYGAVKAADPDSRVILGGLALDWFTSEGGIFDEKFLEEVLAAGGGQYFDVMNFHYYPTFDYRWGGLPRKVGYVRELLAWYGVGDKPLLCTEAGWWSNADVRQGQGSSDEQQSRYVAKLGVQARQAELEAIIWFALVDYPEEAAGRQWGLVRSDLSIKPAFRAFQTLVRELGEARYDRLVGPGDLGVDGLEQHVFSLPGGAGEKSVWWASPGVERPARLAGAEARVVDLYGTESRVADEDDGQADGWLTLTVTEAPIYVEVLTWR